MTHDDERRAAIRHTHDVESLLGATAASRHTMLFSATMPGAVVALARCDRDRTMLPREQVVADGVPPVTVRRPDHAARDVLVEEVVDAVVERDAVVDAEPEIDPKEWPQRLGRVPLERHRIDEERGQVAEPREAAGHHGEPEPVLGGALERIEQHGGPRPNGVLGPRTIHGREAPERALACVRAREAGAPS